MESQRLYEEEGDQVYSNFDHCFELSADHVKNSKKYHCHTAWNFCGYVWFDPQLKKFREEVWRYKSPVKVHENEDLEELIQEVNFEHGGD